MYGAMIYALDDDPDILQILKELLLPLGAGVATFERAQDFYAAFDPNRPGCVLLDLCLPEISGQEVLEQLSRAEPPPTVVIISGSADVSVAIQTLRSGAFDFITKPMTPEQVIERVTAALAADRERRRHHEEVLEARRRFASLSHREREVMLGLLQGRRNKEIATQLGISSRTVEVHRAAVMAKTGIESVTALVLMAARLADRDPEIAAAIAIPPD